MKKRTINNYYLLIKENNNIFEFSQDAFNVYYYTKTNEEALNQILNEPHKKYTTERGVIVYITQEPNSNNNGNSNAEINRLLRNLPKYTYIVNKKECDKIIYQLKKG